MTGQTLPDQSGLVLNSERLRSIDVVRGIVMAIMALDHARDYLVSGDPTDMTTTSVALFCTRLVTHFCAPAFVLLAGVSAYLAKERHQLSETQLSRRLVKRGGWLILLDVTVLPVLWWFNFDYSLLVLGVLWAIGWSMIVLAALVFLPSRWIAAIGISMIVLHNVTDGLRFGDLHLVNGLWSVMHLHTALRPIDGLTVIVGYPLVPWIGVMLVGYVVGELMVNVDQDQRRRRLLVIGVVLTAAFGIVRGINFYGDPSPWSPQETATFTLLSILNCTKYPPSFSFLLMTLGPIFLIMSLVGEKPSWWKRPPAVLGRTPLFFYLLHIVVLHLVAVVFSLAKYGRSDWWFRNPPFDSMPDDYGCSLPVLYVVWIGAVTATIPICHAYSKMKR